MTNGMKKVWWIPQVPSNTNFEVPVETMKEAVLVLNTLAQYDIYQFEHNIKPDYCNAGGLIVWEDGEWVDWEGENGETIDDVIKLMNQA